MGSLKLLELLRLVFSRTDNRFGFPRSTASSSPDGCTFGNSARRFCGLGIIIGSEIRYLLNWFGVETSDIPLLKGLFL